MKKICMKSQLLFNTETEKSFSGKGIRRLPPPTTIFRLFLFLLAILQIFFISYMNLFESSKMIDYDGAKLYKHAIEMWENKSLFLPGWKYITTMELDCSLLLALPFYGIFRNIFISFGIANILFVLCYTAIILALFRNTPFQGYGFLAVNLVLAPYSSGMLEYFNMMFFNGSQYVIKVMVPLLLVLLITAEKGRIKKAGNIALMVFYAFLLFLTSLSSGIYVMFCGILPLFLYALWDFIQDGGFKKYTFYHIGLLALTLSAFVCGTLFSRLIGVQARGNQMLLTKAENWQSNFHAVFLGIFQVLEAIPTGDVAAVSGKGILSFVKIFITLLLLAVCLFQMKNIWKATDKITPERFLAILFPWNLAILLFIDTRYSASNLTMEYRYYLIAFIPLMLLLSMQAAHWLERANRMCQSALFLFISLALIVLCAGNFKNIWERREISLYVNDICDYINGLDLETESVFFIPDEETPEMCRLLDDSRTYCGYNPENGGLVIYDYYYSYIDRSSHGNKNLLFVYNWETPDMYLPSYISGQYEKVGSVRWYDVYYSPANLFDSVSGFPAGSDTKDSIDFFFSPGYVSNPANSQINDNGELEVNGNGEEAVSNSTFLPVSGTYSVELFYETTSEAEPGLPIGTLEIRNQNGNVTSAQLLAGQDNILLENCQANEEVLGLHITISEGVSCKLKMVHFLKED